MAISNSYVKLPEGKSSSPVMLGNNVLLVKIEELVWYTIYQRNLLLKEFLQTPLCSSTNQWENYIYVTKFVNQE